MNNKIKYIKSFSKGQITIPKEFRDMFGLGDNFWLKVFVDKGRIVAEPTEKVRKKQDDYLQKILKIKGDWFSEKEWQNTRKEIEQRLKKQSL